MRSIALAPGAEVTLMRATRSTHKLPAGTFSPGSRSTGTDSPVRALSSKLAALSSNVASVGRRPPAATSITSSGRKSATGTRVDLPSTISTALSGISAISALTPLRARLAAKDSSRSPIINSSNTMAASAVAPINSAPSAATLIRVSMVKGEPARVARRACNNTGHRPTSVVSTKAASPRGWLKFSRIQLAEISTMRISSGAYSFRRDVSTAASGRFWSSECRVNPARVTACCTSAERSLSALTSNFSVANWTLTPLIPARVLTAFSMVRAQAGQSMPSTFQLSWQAPAGIPLGSLSPSPEPSSSLLDVGEYSLGCERQLSDAQQADAASGALSLQQVAGCGSLWVVSEILLMRSIVGFAHLSDEQPQPLLVCLCG